MDTQSIQIPEELKSLVEEMSKNVHEVWAQIRILQGWTYGEERNNVEVTMFQYCFHTRNNKTRYRTKIKHTLQAIARCAWINMRRLFLYDFEMDLQMATK